MAFVNHKIKQLTIKLTVTKHTVKQSDIGLNPSINLNQIIKKLIFTNHTVKLPISINQTTNIRKFAMIKTHTINKTTNTQDRIA